MKRIVAATGNLHKLQEIRSILTDWEIISLRDVDCACDPEENGKTFTENASIKARAACIMTGLPCLADDSGLCVQALGGAPGIRSARYASDDDKNASDAENRKLLLQNLVGEVNRIAYFESAVVLAFPDGTQIESNGRCYGKILFDEVGNNGFGYDSLFYSDELQKSFAEATEEEKNSVSHRRKALDRLAVKLAGLDV